MVTVASSTFDQRSDSLGDQLLVARQRVLGLPGARQRGQVLGGHLVQLDGAELDQRLPLRTASPSLTWIAATRPETRPPGARCPAGRR